MSFKDRLSEIQMANLAEIYAKHECLWNVNNDLYKKKEARDMAYKQIAEKLDIPGLLADDIPKKINNLRSSYYAEVKKVEKSIRHGFKMKYTPKVAWFRTVDNCLKSFSNQKKNAATSENMKGFCASDDENEHAAESSEKFNNEEHSNSSTEPTWVFANPEAEHSRPSNNERLHQHHIPSPPHVPPKRRKNGTYNNSNSYKIVSNTNRMTERFNYNCGGDEYDLFGKYIAATLKAMPWEASIIAKLELQKTLADVQLKTLRSHSINPLPEQHQRTEITFLKNEYTDSS